jgi:ABC-type Fe3+ transport system substrate-binding protein
MPTADSGAIEVLPPPALAVVDWLLTGASEQQVREALAEKYPQANQDQIMRQVQAQLGAAGNPDRAAVKGWALLAYRRLYQEMLQVGDYDGCRKVIKEITNLVG